MEQTSLSGKFSMGDYYSSDDEHDYRTREYYRGRRFYIMYHGTTLSAARKIMCYGFKPSTDGMLGPGVYISRSLKKAKRYPLHPEPGQRLAILKLRVRVGKVKKIDYQGHPLQKTWYENGYDTAWVPPNCGMVLSGLEEDCVWDTSRIKVLDMWEVRNDNDDSDEGDSDDDDSDDDDSDDDSDSDNYDDGDDGDNDHDEDGDDNGEDGEDDDKDGDNNDDCCKCRIL
ncbi:uncharacterized protein LOC131370224 [Hemibagrus wyckioides]|uniref:uncharacterized protein LOC131370224 n=1 Tax=Hemibagrus wyckioides TaxID=337641 RepID=UPI00266BEF14|nr:uncharacterized protein LOC131370224 [Hemibagrus wyckioides]